MLFQILVGSLMHALDVTSDIYVIYLWYHSGRKDLFVAGVFFMVFSSMVTARAGLNYLGRAGRGFRTRCIFVLLAPLNFHNYVFGFFVLKDRHDVFSWESFSLLKVMHSGLESTPFALVTGIDLLSANISREAGFLVKVTSFGLSVFSIVFSVVVQTYLTNGWPGGLALDFFCHASLDVLLTVMAVGYNIDALGARYGALTVCVAIGILGAAVYTVILDLFNAERSTVSFLADIMRPYGETFGWPESHVCDVKNGSRHVSWIIPFISLGTIVVTGANFFMFDMLYAMPQPAAKVLEERKERKELCLAIVRRAVIYALCAVFVISKFSHTKMLIVVVCIPAHLFFTLRCRGMLGAFSISVLLYHCLTVALLPLYLLVVGVNAFGQNFNKYKLRQTAHDHSLAPTVLTRPQQRATGEEEEFYALCENILAEAVQEVLKPGCRNKTELQELMKAITECGVQLTQSLDNSDIVDIVALTKVLQPFHPMSPAEDLTCIIRNLRDCKFMDIANSSIKVDRHDLTAESTCVAQKSVKLVSAYDACYDAERHGDSAAHFRAVRFRTVANMSIWLDKRPDKRSFELSTETSSADFFLSHCWNDPPEAKAALLRSFLFVQTFVAVTLSGTVVFAVALIPTGIILSEINAIIIWWAPCVLVLCMGGLVLLWTLLAHFTETRSTFGPWGLSRISCWLDKCCIDQSSPESKMVGIAHLGDSLERCNCMIVIFSKQYLERMWCTYELAAYCKLMQDHPEKKLIFLSLSWSAWYNPMHFGKPVKLSEDEEDALRNYSCKNAKIWKREDRDIVLRKIEQQWGSAEQFDSFVHEEMPKVLLRGKFEYYQQFKNILLQSCTLMFG